jgi:hypothetical protein
MKISVLIMFVMMFITSSCTDSNKSRVVSKELTPILSITETEQMVIELEKLVENGSPEYYYHWNADLAELFKVRMKGKEGPEYWRNWLSYCSELLNAGKSRECITEIENTTNTVNVAYSEVLNAKNINVFELLGLAYLRLGEQENCQNKHTEFSCILPLKTPAVHELKEGSQKAIEIFSLLQDQFPSAQYKWMINLAYMTLGEHPKAVPASYLISYPNWSLEQKDFPRFKEVASSLGVGVNGLSGGTCVDDFNNDGLLDIFATSYGMTDQVKLFLNDGKGGFSDVTEASGLTGIVSGLNSIHADYDNDGNKDILILRGAWLGEGGAHPNSLLKNNGDGTFQDVTRSSGILSYHPTQTASWGDFNKDGFLDLFIGNEGTRKYPHPCELYKNNGDGTFSEVSEQAGIKVSSYVKGVTWGDMNNDGWPDLFVSVLGGNNLLFKNTNGKFHDIGKLAGIQEPINSFPCWFWDVNNDGLLDIFVSGYDTRNLDGIGGDFAKELENLPVTTSKPRLYINVGNERFEEHANDYGISKTMYAMGANFGDLDNDGFLDFYVGTGTPNFNSVLPNRMFRNVGGKRFEEVTSAGGFGHIQKGHGVAFADMDRDGDQDIYAVMGGAYEGDVFTNVLFENPIAQNNWICIELEGGVSNKNAIGSRIELTLDNGNKVYRTVSTGGSFGASSLQQEIGIGKAESIKKITVYWMNSKRQEFSDIRVNQKILITEGISGVENVEYSAIPFKLQTSVHHH